MTAAALADHVRTTLPRGRHALSPAEVSASQRARLIWAMTDEVAERGFAATTAARVFQRAGVSSRAFYENFTDVGDCFLAAYEACVAHVMRASLAPSPAGGSTSRHASGRPRGREDPTAKAPLGRFAAMLDTYLRLIASEPNVARTFLVEVYGAGPEALQRRLEVHEQFVVGVAAVLVPGRRPEAWELEAVEALVDAITFRVTRLVIGAQLGDLCALREELVSLTRRICPWVGA